MVYVAQTEPSTRLAGYFVDIDQVKSGEAVVRDGDGWLYFSSPSDVLLALSPADVAHVLDSADRHVRAGGWVVGFVAYEADFWETWGLGDLGTWGHRDKRRPLAWFSLFDSPPGRFRELLPSYNSVPIELESLEWDEAEYRQKFAAVKDALQRGETYQVNLTMRQPFRLTRNADDFFVARCGVNPPPYAAYLNGGDWVIASFSPELFFERVGTEISSKPMKGTVVRPKNRAAEIEAASALVSDPKSIAENIMIVDMVRNDLGSIADVGSVRVPRMLQVERHRELLQMTSTVTAQSSVSTLELFRGLFPASVTGAPKVSTCRLIGDLEDSPRGVYCGAIGFMDPERQRFSVAIRTAWIDVGTGDSEFGIGSGIVWDSDAEQEYAECLAKRDFLLNEGLSWALIEALPGHELRNDSVVGRHLERLSKAAKEFDIAVDVTALSAELRAMPESSREERMKVRIALQLDGRFSIKIEPSAIVGASLTAVIASHPVDSADPNRRFKTTSRSVYDAHLNAHPEADEVLLYIKCGKLTEFCRGNVVLRLDGLLITPHPATGCLAGVGVARMVEAGEVKFGEPTVGDLRRCEGVFFVNSVAGCVPVDLGFSVPQP